MVDDALMSLNETVRSTNSSVNRNSRLATLLDKRVNSIFNTATNSSKVRAHCLLQMVTYLTFRN